MHKLQIHKLSDILLLIKVFKLLMLFCQYKVLLKNQTYAHNHINSGFSGNHYTNITKSMCIFNSNNQQISIQIFPSTWQYCIFPWVMNLWANFHILFSTLDTANLSFFFFSCQSQKREIPCCWSLNLHFPDH